MKAARYAEGTVVDVGKSQSEVVAVLKKNGAVQNFFGEDGKRAIVGFSMRGRQVRFSIPYPSSAATEEEEQRMQYWSKEAKQREQDKRDLVRDAEIRRRWRCLLISIKAKFEAVTIAESISDEYADQAFRSEFLSQTVLVDGKTVAEVVLPLVEKNYKTRAPLMLTGLGEDDE